MGIPSFNCVAALGFLALAGAFLGQPAEAQAGLRGKQAAGSLTSPTQTTTTSGLPQPATETKDVEGVLAAQNEVRRRLNLAPLTWSGPLTALARQTADDAAGKACSRTSTLKAGDASSAAVYWAAALPRYSGGFSSQTISPGFVISEWQEGRADYDSATRECRSSGECQSWARMVAPGARAVGCVRVICQSQAQIWACQYDTPGAAGPSSASTKPASKSPTTQSPDLRRRTGN